MRLQRTAYTVLTQFVLNTEQYRVNHIKENETVTACSINGADKKYIQNFVKEHEGKRPPERFQHRKKNCYYRLPLKQYHKKIGNRLIWIRTAPSS
jgi:hypothetical protein